MVSDSFMGKQVISFFEGEEVESQDAYLYRPDTFSSKNHTWVEIAQAMCQSELVHETNIVFSFVPLALRLVWRKEGRKGTEKLWCVT